MEDIKKLYKEAQATARNELRRSGCNSDIFEDIYHEAFIILIKMKKGSGNEFRVNSWYITQICKNLWFREQRNQNLYDKNKDVEHIHAEETGTDGERKALLFKHFKNLPPECHKVLTLFSNGYSEKKISSVLNLKDIKAVKNIKYYCRAKLKSLIRNDSLYKEING